MFYYISHLLLAFSWAILLLTFIKILSFKTQDFTEAKIFGVLSFLTMILILLVGTKMMLLNPAIAKNGSWLHIKLSIDIILMVENSYLLFCAFKKQNLSKKNGNILYVLTFLGFLSMVVLTLTKAL